MPFTCKFQLNNGAITKDDEVIFKEYINDSFENFFENPVSIAKVIFNGKNAFIVSNCPCFPSTVGNLKSGDRIDEKTLIANFSANGEDIPYNRPYAKVEIK